MHSVEVLGYSAAALTSLSFVPQVLKSIRSRDTSSISLLMYSLFGVGVGCWLVWGYLSKQMPVVLANGFVLTMSSIILGMKIFAVVTKKERP